MSTALQAETELTAFCLTLAITGARISEALALGASGVDAANECVVFRTLKLRGKSRFRMFPVPALPIDHPTKLRCDSCADRLWWFHRTYAWAAFKSVMSAASIGNAQCTPKTLRHGFAVGAVLNGGPLNVHQRWMGHARLETTAIYACVLGNEERELARRTWPSLEGTMAAH